MAVGAIPGGAQSQAESPEVRQIVTFQFLPGRAEEAFRIYEQQLRPIYHEIPELLRFRGYQEAESPEPLDLIVVSSYRGMAGMDRANEGLRRPPPSGPSALSLYGTLSAMTARHHDQFVEMLANQSDSATGGRLVVFDYLRLAPGAGAAFEGLLTSRVRPFEKAGQLALWSETGRLLVSDGWDYLRIFGVGSLGDWHRYLTAMGEAPFHGELGSLVAARKTILVRQAPKMAVR